MVRRNSQKGMSGVAPLGRFDQYHDAIVTAVSLESRYEGPSAWCLNCGHCEREHQKAAA